MGRGARKYSTGGLFFRTPSKDDENKLYPVYIIFFCDGKKVWQSTDIRCMAKN